MWKFAFVLFLFALSVHAEDEKPTEKGPSLVETALCYISPKPWSCVREQAGRMLNSLDATVEEKRHELMAEADEEMEKSETPRSLAEDEKNQKPSEVMGAVDKAFSAIANLMTDEVDVLQGRESRAMKQGKGVGDDVNDFNDDDYSLIDALSKAEGNLSESRAKKSGKDEKQLGQKQAGFGEDGGFGYSGYGYGGKGKKGKKGKKGLMKLFFLGAIVKSKVELLLKVLSFHLQLKFFAIALASLVINLARFWIDLKKHPSKHHYDEHDDWGSSWKRQTNNQQEYQQPDNFAHRLAYGSPQYPQQL